LGKSGIRRRRISRSGNRKKTEAWGEERKQSKRGGEENYSLHILKTSGGGDSRHPRCRRRSGGGSRKKGEGFLGKRSRRFGANGVHLMWREGRRIMHLEVKNASTDKRGWGGGGVNNPHQVELSAQREPMVSKN